MTATLDKVFLDRLEELRTQAASLANSLQGASSRKWQVPEADGWDGNVLDLEGISKAYDRQGLNQAYEDLLKGGKGGSVGECAALKLQIDYLAVLERAFRTRHMTSVRARMHAAGRRRGHGNKSGVFTGSIVPHVQNLLKVGQS